MKKTEKKDKGAKCLDKFRKNLDLLVEVWDDHLPRSTKELADRVEREVHDYVIGIVEHLTESSGLLSTTQLKYNVASEMRLRYEGIKRDLCQMDSRYRDPLTPRVVGEDTPPLEACKKIAILSAVRVGQVCNLFSRQLMRGDTLAGCAGMVSKLNSEVGELWQRIANIAEQEKEDQSAPKQIKSDK